MKRTLTSTAFVLVLLSLTITSVSANWGAHLLDRESKGMSVPSYCKAKFKGRYPNLTKRQITSEKKFLAESFIHVHHLCWAMVHIWDLEAAKAAGKKTDLHKAGQAVKEISYFYSRTPKDHPVMRDVHRAYARAYHFTGDDAKSKAHYKKSLRMSPHLPSRRSRTVNSRPPTSASASRYVEMADKMMRIGVPGEAVELLKLALKIEPNSKIIQTKLKTAKAAKAAQ